MSGVYSRNKLFETFCWAGLEVLPNLEVDFFADDSTEMTDFENYETMIDDSWPDFIKDSCLGD